MVQFQKDDLNLIEVILDKASVCTRNIILTRYKKYVAHPHKVSDTYCTLCSAYCRLRLSAYRTRELFMLHTRSCQGHIACIPVNVNCCVLFIFPWLIYFAVKLDFGAAVCLDVSIFFAPFVPIIAQRSMLVIRCNVDFWLSSKVGNVSGYWVGSLSWAWLCVRLWVVVGCRKWKFAR